MVVVMMLRAPTVEIKVLEAELFESLVKGFLDLFGFVGVVPELRSDEELLALHNGGDDFLQGTANFVLILVDAGKIEVPIAVADGDFHLKWPCKLNRDA